MNRREYLFWCQKKWQRRNWTVGKLKGTSCRVTDSLQVLLIPARIGSEHQFYSNNQKFMNLINFTYFHAYKINTTRAIVKLITHHQMDQVRKTVCINRFYFGSRKTFYYGATFKKMYSSANYRKIVI